MSMEVAFGDDIINATELKRNWGHWVAQAYDHPITILYKNDHLTLTRRKYISEMSRRMYYTYLVASICRGVMASKDISHTLSWAAYLNDTDKGNFFTELLNAFEESYAKDDWGIIQDVIDDWKATAEVERSPKLSKALRARGKPSEYVEIKE